MDEEIDVAGLRDQLMALQERICAALETEDGEATFAENLVEQRGGLGRPRVLDDGPVVERAAVNFSHTVSAELPAAATGRRPDLAGAAFEAVSISLIVHPRNPYAPTSHANFRCFVARPPDVAPVWWFGGGFDLTPYYAFDEDAVHWHRTARDACQPFGDELYPRFKENCDKYFYLPHRDEARGIGGIFFDDWSEGGFERSRQLVLGLGDAFLAAYLPILQRRKGTEYGVHEREFQLYRRGRYVEFNLLHDRGTRFGLELGGRTESILASLPPRVTWRYGYEAEPGTPEARLVEVLRPRDWLAGG